MKINPNDYDYYAWENVDDEPRKTKPKKPKQDAENEKKEDRRRKISRKKELWGDL